MSNDRTTAASPSGGADFRDVAHAHKPFPTGRLLLWVAVLLIAANFLWIVAHNENFGWPVVAAYFFDPTVINGLYVSLGLTVVAMAIGIVLGLGLAIARLSNDRLARSLASLFIWFFRGTPLLVQLIFWYNLSTLFPELSITIPFGPTLASWETNSVITPMTAAIVGLALNEAAYMAEIIRGGLLSVDRGQFETAEAFGMTKARALWRIIIPQAMRSIVPPTGNQLISMIKATSLVSVIAMADLLYSVQSIYNRTFEIVPMLLVAVLWYLLITSILNLGQSYIEAYYGRSERRNNTAAAKSETLTEEASH
ncbi:MULTISPECIES: amino acid ABC transporter permease [Rhizobium]|uniref:amino acid ABC transporter permease n=1 Tax=Rhizobium TaxID=379 RepID=UPI000374C174|nr:amino acid ABC transporter permease [Rhizobium leguminosarum]MBY2908691.1 amino acid ABC transporter permease [Rhizobium leguminosarum]MBY2942717.1 amino acid ABC transporter permease [Rhizobium leguminosarum]MBY2963828.1 amino acid ABC transporter permease [Rhizobium leguminosarum]MBY2991864.1 amino acid ABC transporter permease [Rhizobium leguminosarum]MBY2999437.1 amino acid ABC transporter permease [Rhizobium leguminosarum]